MVYQKPLYLIEVLNSLQSSWRNLTIYWASKLNYQWHTICRQTDKQNESIKRLNNISDYLLAIDRMIGQNGLQVLSLLTIIKSIPLHVFPLFMQTMVTISRWELNLDVLSNRNQLKNSLSKWTIHEEAQVALSKVCDDMQHYADFNRGIAPEYKVGNKVWLSSKNLNVDQPSHKLMEWQLGPFEVVKIMSSNAIKLKLPASFRIHDLLMYHEFDLISLLLLVNHQFLLNRLMLKEPPNIK